jgi:heme/copper-type cytochrome/quinol oxidase subunit 2
MRVGLLLLILAVLLVPLPTSHTPRTHLITIDASQFEYSPSRLTINKGDTVRVTLASSDVVHGFFLDGYEIEHRVEPGISREFTFVADRTGKFRYRCSVTCGPLHPFMIGELVVGPNELVWRASALAIIAVVAMLFGARHRRSA